MVGRELRGDDLLRFGARAGVLYYIRMQVVGMGDLHGCDIAQATHESIVETSGLMQPGVRMRYDDPMPSGRLWEGILCPA